MVPMSQRRRHSRWRMFSIFVIFLSLVGDCELLPAKKLSDSGPSLVGGSSRRSGDVGSPDDLAWQAWLRMDPETSASLYRRITPKSVFIAPALPACAEGYSADAMNRCVKNVNIDQHNHLAFFLQRLNAMYANRGDSSGIGALSSSKDDQKQSSGPLQLNIPLLSDIGSQSSKVDHEETDDSMEVPVVVPVVVPARSGIDLNEKKEPQEVVVTIYDVKNDTSSDEVFFPGNTSTGDSDKDDPSTSSKTETVVPVAEFVEDANETSFSEIVDYKFPIDTKTLLNESSVKRINTTVEPDVARNGSQFASTSEPTSTLVPLLASKLPNVDTTDDKPQLDNDTVGYAIPVLMSNSTNGTDKEIISGPEFTHPNKLSVVPLVVLDSAENNETQNESNPEHQSPGVNESHEVEAFYDDEDDEEDYADTTELPDDESEGGEILKHGEAGMAIPVKDIERLQLEKHLKQQQQNETTIFESLDKVYIRFNDSSSDKEDKDEAGSNVSSEVSINGDMIVETTLLDVNTDPLRNKTKLPDSNRTKTIQDDDEDLKELFEPQTERDSEPEVIFSPQNVHGTVSTSSRGRKRTGSAKPEAPVTEDPKSDELVAAPSSSESLLYDPHTPDHPNEDRITEIRTIDDHSSDGKDSTLSEGSKDSSPRKTFEPNPVNNGKAVTLNFKQPQDYNGFQSYGKQSAKFPSEEVNSIHSQDYKDRVPYPLDDGLHSSTKSSVYVHQKPSYRGSSRSKLSNRQQVVGQQTQTTASSHQKLPIVVFWSNMPLSRDPSLDSTGQTSQSKTISSDHHPNRYPKVSPS